MIQIRKHRRGVIIVTACLLLLVQLNNTFAADVPVAGLTPDQRPAGAPVITEVTHDGNWYKQTLRGVEKPYPPSIRFLESQGDWFTPFRAKSMPDRYDIRGLFDGPPNTSYHTSRWHPMHFKPGIDSATNEQCLSCHQEITTRKILNKSPAGVDAAQSLAWYQTLETYEGPQETFHRRHLETPFAKKLMNMKCTTCHQGNDIREETSNSAADSQGGLTMRKMVNPEVCLMCHGTFNYKVMTGLPSAWTESRNIFQNNCLTCHTAFRTNRHDVNFLNKDAIEEAGKESGDSCYGCHGGRAWYRINYPYPRHEWPGMAKDIPEWAAARPTSSNPRFLNK